MNKLDLILVNSLFLLNLKGLNLKGIGGSVPSSGSRDALKIEKGKHAERPRAEREGAELSSEKVSRQMSPFY